jgi:hypothetical protein
MIHGHYKPFYLEGNIISMKKFILLSSSMLRVRLTPIFCLVYLTSCFTNHSTSCLGFVTSV